MCFFWARILGHRPWEWGLRSLVPESRKLGLLDFNIGTPRFEARRFRPPRVPGRVSLKCSLSICANVIKSLLSRQHICSKRLSFVPQTVTLWAHLCSLEPQVFRTLGAPKVRTSSPSEPEMHYTLDFLQDKYRLSFFSIPAHVPLRELVFWWNESERCLGVSCSCAIQSPESFLLYFKLPDCALQSMMSVLSTMTSHTQLR